MARGVTIDSGPVEAEYPLRNVPQERWRELMLVRRRFLEVNISYDCRCLVQFVNDAQEMFGALGFESPEAMIRSGYDLEPAEVSLAVEWLKLNPPNEPISLARAVELGQREIGIAGGKAGPGRGKKTGGITARLSRSNGSRAYILARLDRDGHAELAAMVRAGMMSANAAAIQAGFRKKLTPFEQVLRLLDKLTEEELQAVHYATDERNREAAA